MATAPETKSKARLQAEARALRAELAKRSRLPNAVAAYLEQLTSWQRTIVDSPAPRIAVFAGRRTGKTFGPGVGRALVTALKYPGTTFPVFERTLTCQAAKVFWKTLNEVVQAHKLEARPNHATLGLTLSNRSVIQLMGADTIEACDKARGEGFPGAIVDEAGTFRPHVLKYLLDEVLDPALFDYRGALALLGTPIPRFEDNPFWEACASPKLADSWERHHSTVFDNDALPRTMASATSAERRAARIAEFEAMLRRKGLTADEPFIQREWLGKWVRDTNGLVYRLAGLNHVDVQSPDLSLLGWRFGLGIDLGYEDPCAFVVLAWRPGDSRVWVVESYQAGHLIPSAVAAHVERLRARYRFGFIVADTGGYGKGPVEEMRALGIPVVAASKRDKEAHIWIANGELQSGQLLIPESPNHELLADLYGLRRDEDGKEHANDANHLPDALLYSLMELRGRLRRLGDAEPPSPDSPAGKAAFEAAIEAEDDEVHRQQYGGGPGDLLSTALGMIGAG